MAHYSEELRTRTNDHGVERGDVTNALWLGSQGAENRGMDGDGTLKTATMRLWFSETALTDLPDGVAEMTELLFDELTATRERTKPVRPPAPDPPERPLSDSEIRAVRALLV